MVVYLCSGQNFLIVANVRGFQYTFIVCPTIDIMINGEFGDGCELEI